MERERLCGIYCIENLINGKRYIGQSKDIHRRWGGHISKLRNNRHKNEKLQNAWNKYGESNFHFNIIEIVDAEKLDEAEVHYIELYNSFKNGYNKDTGGSGQKTMTEETKRKIRESKKYLTDQARENIRNSQESKPIFQVDLDGNIVKAWRGARDASRELKINQAAIWQCLHHDRLTLHGYIWIFSNEIDLLDLSKHQGQNTQPKRICQKNLDGSLVKIWDSANSAQRAGFECSSIIKCCKGRIRCHKGFLWSYYEHNKSETQND